MNEEKTKQATREHGGIGVSPFVVMSESRAADLGEPTGRSEIPDSEVVQRFGEAEEGITMTTGAAENRTTNEITAHVQFPDQFEIAYDLFRKLRLEQYSEHELRELYNRIERYLNPDPKPPKFQNVEEADAWMEEQTLA